MPNQKIFAGCLAYLHVALPDFDLVLQSLGVPLLGGVVPLVLGDEAVVEEGLF